VFEASADAIEIYVDQRSAEQSQGLRADQAAEKGAQASANLFSLVMTARAYGVEPFEYLSAVFELLPAATTLEAIEALLP
jgi:hypothetical protein